MERKRFSLEVSEGLLKQIDQFKREWGLRSRGAIVERLLQELLNTDEHGDTIENESDTSERQQYAVTDGNKGSGGEANNQKHDSLAKESIPQQFGLDIGISDFNERGALVLIAKGERGSLALGIDESGFDPSDDESRSSVKSSGIDLPGFVRKQSAEIKKSLSAKVDKPSHLQEPLPPVPSEILKQALEKAKTYWTDLYGSPANEAVLEAAMVWLAKDIWPQSDQSERRVFTWSVACLTVQEFAPSWPSGAASFEKIMVMAGLLEDPFSASTLQLRLPTLIRRFVHRFRTRKKGTSFQALEHTMTLHGALKLLQLPTSPGHKLTLAQIREAYREIALKTHPDSGGSAEEMRKVNEAYQLLKELYRNG
jgi:hypothetical protein